ncbi:MAG: hypothetical protein M3R24_42305 [Chloroflexota bacterium]|nr:hypothetical protein [Chloroflexota bacterium]
MEDKQQIDLAPLATAACSYPYLLASWIARYQEQYNLDDQAILGVLGLPDVGALHFLALCQPLVYEPQDFRDVFSTLLQISNYLGCCIGGLARILHGVPPHVVWEVCGDELRSSLTTYQARIQPDSGTTYSATITGLNGLVWSSQLKQDRDRLQDQCEDCLLLHSLTSPHVLPKMQVRRAMPQLVQQARAYPVLLANPILAYQEQHQLDDTSLAQYLGVGTRPYLHLLCLCRRPRSEQEPLYFQVNRPALHRVLRQAAVHLVWQVEQRGQRWLCHYPPYEARIDVVNKRHFVASIRGPAGTEWAPGWPYEERRKAQRWCEQRLDMLLTKGSLPA